MCLHKIFPQGSTYRVNPKDTVFKSRVPTSLPYLRKAPFPLDVFQPAITTLESTFDSEIYPGVEDRTATLVASRCVAQLFIWTREYGRASEYLKRMQPVTRMYNGYFEEMELTTILAG